MAEMAQGAAYLVPPGDDAALADVLGSVLAQGTSANDLVRRRENGLERAAQFTWSASVDVHVRAFHLAVGASQ